MSHKNSKVMAGSLPEESGLPTTCRQSQYPDGNVRTPMSRYLLVSGVPAATRLGYFWDLSTRPIWTHNGIRNN